MQPIIDSQNGQKSNFFTNMGEVRFNGHFILVITFFLIFCGYRPIQKARAAETAEDVIQKTISSAEAIKTLTYKLTNTERIENKLLTGEQLVKLSTQPFQCYMYFLHPSEGAEVLYIQNKNDDQLIYSPNSFPYININLDPNGDLARKNNHHSIFEVGFNYIVSIFKNINSLPNTTISLEADVIWETQSCYKLVIDNANYGYTSYLVKRGETVLSIARKLYLSEYAIMQINNNIDDFDDVNEGDMIKIPNVYAKRMELYINKQNYLPLVQKIYDDKGLYEQYEYHDLVVNPSIAAQVFTEDYLGKK